MRDINALDQVQAVQRDEIVDRLRRTESALREIGVQSLYLFGSHARNEARSGSDIDVFIDPVADRPFGFLPFMEAYEALEKAVGRGIDYGTRSGLHPLLRDAIEREAIQIF